jgi:hypothetical protein
MARPSALFLPHINQIDRDLGALYEMIEDAKKNVASNDVGDLREIMATVRGLQRRAIKGLDARKVWEKAMDSETRGCLTKVQNTQLLVVEASQLLPEKYAELKLTDVQLATLAPKLKEFVPSINDLKASLSAPARKNSRPGLRKSLVKMEAQLADAVNSVLTDAQRAQLKKEEASQIP